MTTQMRVGIFTLLALAGVFAAYYFITNFALRHTGFQLGVHFHDVGGLQEGSTVLLSGVQVGQVTSVQLLPDQTVDVIAGLLDYPLPGFGEHFRMLSYQQIGSGAMLSRAIGGIARGKIIFCLPGSTNAVELAMTKLILPELKHLQFELRK